MTVKSHLDLLYDRKSIDKAVRRLAKQIKKDYHGKNLLIIGILKGAFIFMADLIRCLEIDFEIDFIQLSSYINGKESRGNVNIGDNMNLELINKDILIIEDIIDTGISLQALMSHLTSKNPSSIKLCVLLDKPSRRQVPVKVDYLGFEIPDKFVVGYGMDHDEKYRNLPEIYILNE